MNDHGILCFKDPDTAPTDDALEQALGGSYPAYEALQDALPPLAIEQEWQWYSPYKAWFAKGEYRWVTPRGAKKEKNLYWLYPYEGFFTVAVWFKEKNREALLAEELSENARNRVRESETMGKLPTFPVLFDVTGESQLDDIYTLIDAKKRLEK